ncbi:helicase-exonuclease AddAB subunit AddB [Bacillus sp. WMMC1349]|uniref:helicase-exonuclease AddAB subunit AddB n=1 Tax=Bacillus sp. WMMC1349 TaxID=2736254 RepID=UPI001552440E|nr:helicase-exonuclease AddAB subunit AddB [Bacillus sp. WMMC1349]NPC92125.1 helicase-exonuclease AddAB subunit AddB [Bacillus sp. WMMC1349]
MGVLFLSGRSGSGKTTFILDEMRGKLRQHPLGKPIIFLVPDQMTFLMEYELSKTPDLGGMFRAQVYSFSRLAWWILQRTGGINRKFLTSSGIQMLLRKLIEEHKTEFRVYQNASDKNGFTEQVERMLAEFKRHCLSPESIREIIQGSEVSEYEDERVLSDKLHDLYILYSKMEESLEQQYVHSEDYLQLLAEQIPYCEELKGAVIYVDGFHRFTPQEMNVLEKLMVHAQEMTFSLTTDEPFTEQVPHELHLFRMTGKMYFDLYQKTKELGLNISVKHLTNVNRHKHVKELKHLERYVTERPLKVYKDRAEALCVMQAANRRTEIEGIAREIQSLVRTGCLRFKDIAVIARNVEDYKDTIKEVFKDYELAFFIDGKEPMQNHPLIELIRSTLDVIKGNWGYEAVFRCIKTELLFPHDEPKNLVREQVDQLENYCIAHGIKGDRWTRKDRFIYRRYASLDGDFVQTDREIEIENMLNELKDWIVPPVYRLQKRLKEARSVKAMAEAVYLYLEEAEIPLKLEEERLNAEENGKIIESRQHDQVWNAVIQLLDEFVEMMGDEDISFSLFRQMMETGLDSLRFALIPPALDQVFIGNMDLSRMYDVKCTFIIGVNDGILPAKPDDDGVLSDDDREWLKRNGAELAATGREQLLDENFLIYMALSSPSEKLYVSYPIADAEGKTLLSSTVVKQLEELFPGHGKKLLSNEPEQLSDEEQLEFLVNKSTALSYLASQLSLWTRQYMISDVWWSTYNFLMRGPDRSFSQNILSSLFFRNKVHNLNQHMTRELYGENIQGSVSRMETYNACPFSHFASHGLKLKERQFFKLEAPDIGQLFHSALKLIADRLHELKLDWRDLTKEQCDKLSFDAIERLAPKLQKEILLSSNRHHYVKQKLQKIIARVSGILSEHAKASGFAPVGLELGFGGNGPLPPMRFTLQNGCTMELVGRIDRVDKAESSKGLLLRIVDYKSSDKGLDLAEVYYGLALQMLTYLDLSITYSTDWLGMKATPAGVLYFHVHDPMIQASVPLGLDEIEKEIFKKFKMKGLLLGDQEVVKLMDTTLEQGRSDIISAGLKKDGSLRSDSAVISEDHFHLLRDHIRRTFQKAGEEITNGKVSIEPYKLKDRTPCTFCSYKSFCQFDESLEENQYRVLKPEKDNVILDWLKKEDETNGD